MVIKKDDRKPKVFNLMDTNGRRSDVLNALKIYLEILEELKEEYPAETWGKYPNSISQFLFYEKALEKSKDVFEQHKGYDKFVQELGAQRLLFLNKDCEWIADNFPRFKKVLDKDVEQRARHYSSNLVKIGFTDEKRNITEVGYSYLKGSISRDAIEELLPLDNINIVLLRQLSKLKIFSEPDMKGNRRFYSPFFMALELLLNDENIDKGSFAVIVQGLSPYSDESIKASIAQNIIGNEELENAIQNIAVIVPEGLSDKSDIEFDLFKSYFKSSKASEAASRKYYNFFITLKNFRENRCEDNYNALLKCFENDSAILYKAFGYGKAVFNFGNKGNRYDLKTFLEKNSDHHLLKCDDYVSEIFIAFSKSKWIDGVKEYSDTTIRLLSATGLFKFKNLPELSYKDILSVLFDVSALRSNIFGVMTEEQYLKYEVQEDCYFEKCTSIADILGYSKADVDTIIASIERHLGVSDSKEVKLQLKGKKNADFLSHINEKYPKEKIMELLPLFSDRSKDSRIKKEVNDAASVPTIYEYIIGIAWYYISNKDFDLYSSLNLTLNADFDPVIHAGGGDGDIVITYDDIIVMLEVTLMNKQAQKRGEWEPVLRHSLNLKAANEPKETITFFIADELDYNTVNIWRAVAAVLLESTNTHKAVDGVVIMPFTNCEILSFLEKGIHRTQIIEEVKKSFEKVPQITDVKWREDIMTALR